MSSSARNRESEGRGLITYWERVQSPLQSLYFLLPLLAIYEIGTLRAGGQLPRIWAESLLDGFFQRLGVTSYHLPAIIVVVVLLSWHLVRRDPWKPEWRLYPLMLVEAIALALPLFVFSAVLFRGQSTLWVLAQNTSEFSYGSDLLLAIGAGIYEELLFRLIAIALLHMLLVDLLALPDAWGSTLAVLISAAAFAVYHFPDLNQVDATRFFFFMLAGIYLAMIYVLRGFGVVVAVHALYDVAIESVQHFQQ